MAIASRAKPRGSRQRPNLWQVLAWATEGAIYLLVIGLFLKLFQPELDRQTQIQAEIERLQKVQDEREARVTALRKEHQWLDNDPDYVESVSRDRLNLMKEGEYIFQLERD
ncbi:MAG: septum formation initiator family protein [Verrucomicrobiota bacterium]